MKHGKHGKRKETEQPLAKGLDYYIDNIQETCDKCGKKLVVHAFRKKTAVKSQAVYASCQNKGLCTRAGLEICFVQKL